MAPVGTLTEIDSRSFSKNIEEHQFSNVFKSEQLLFRSSRNTDKFTFEQHYTERFSFHRKLVCHDRHRTPRNHLDADLFTNHRGDHWQSIFHTNHVRSQGVSEARYSFSAFSSMLGRSEQDNDFE